MADFLILFLEGGLLWLLITVDYLRDGLWLVHTSYLYHSFLNTYVAINMFGKI